MYDFVMRTHNLYFKRRRQELSIKSGVSLDTLNKVFQKQTKNPKAKTIQAIYDVLIKEDRKARRAASTVKTAAPPDQEGA